MHDIANCPACGHPMEVHDRRHCRLCGEKGSTCPALEPGVESPGG